MSATAKNAKQRFAFTLTSDLDDCYSLKAKSVCVPKPDIPNLC